MKNFNVNDLLEKIANKSLTVNQAVKEMEGNISSFASFSSNYQPKDIVKAYCEILDSKAYKQLAMEAKEAKEAKRNLVEEVRCDCGRVIAKDQIMSASFGRACPGCYDDKS